MAASVRSFHMYNAALTKEFARNTSLSEKNTKMGMRLLKERKNVNHINSSSAQQDKLSSVSPPARYCKKKQFQKGNQICSLMFFALVLTYRTLYFQVMFGDVELNQCLAARN